MHMAWAETSPTIKKIQYPMLADPAGKLATALDVRDEASGQAFRGTFIIDPDGVIQAYVVNNFGIGRNADEILRTLYSSATQQQQRRRRKSVADEYSGARCFIN